MCEDNKPINKLAPLNLNVVGDFSTTKEIACVDINYLANRSKPRVVLYILMYIGSYYKIFIGTKTWRHLKQVRLNYSILYCLFTYW